MKLIRAEDIAYINVYELDLEQILTDGYKMLKMEAYDREWLDFIVASRNGQKP